MKAFCRTLASLVAVSVLSFSLLAVAVDEKPLDDPAKEALARAIMKDIRCLVCQNQSIEDSNADLAKDLRQIVRERVALGDDAANVEAYLVDRYGDWVLLSPPVKTSTYFLWGSPFVFLALVGVALLFRKQKVVTPTPLNAEEEAQLKALLSDEETRS